MISDERGVIAAPGTAKARIERAALTLFCESSIDGASTKSIAQLAGVSEGLLYRHFKSKDDLARQMMMVVHERLTEMIRTQEDQPIFAAACAIVGDYCALADEDWDLFHYHILHLHRFPGLSKTPTENPIGAAAELIKAAGDRGELTYQTDESLLASMALGVVLSAAQAKVLGGIEGKLSDYRTEFERAIIAVLRSA